MRSHGRVDAQVRLVSLNFRIPLDLRRQIRIIAAEHGITMTEIVMKSLEEFVRRKEPSGANRRDLTLAQSSPHRGQDTKRNFTHV